MITLPDLVKFFKVPSGMKYIGQAILDGKKQIIINLDDIYEWDSVTANDIINDAVNGGIKAVEDAFGDVVIAESNHAVNPKDIKIGFCGKCIPFVKVHKIEPSHIGKLIRVRGFVNRLYDLKATAVEITFKCRECGATTQPIIQDSPFGLTSPSKKCKFCQERTNYDIVDFLSKFRSSQRFHIQELHEDMLGHMPRRLPMVTYKEWLINRVHCGDVIEIIGVVRTLPTVYRGKMQRDFGFYMEVLHMNQKNKDPERMEISKEDEALIQELATKPDIYQIMVNDIAPTLFGMRKCKEACLLSLFGGVPKIQDDITIRGTIHTLIVGDPSTGKSKLLTSVSDIAPKGMYSQGKGVSGVGLTAALNKDQVSGEWVVDAGVLVLADRGIACIDEIDKMKNEDRDNIHTAMADGIVPINKAGVNVTLPARTAIIAAANPSHANKYDENKSVFENLLNFPSSLFNRFDLIFVLLDKANEERDKKLLAHMRSRRNIKATIPRDLFKKYIAYAKRINPIISEEAQDILGKYWLKARSYMMDENKEETHPIKARQYDALERLCEARARSLLKTEADKEDAECVLRLFNEFLEEISFDIDVKEGGHQQSKMDRFDKIMNIIKRLQKERFDGVSKEEIINEAIEKGIPKRVAQKIVLNMIRNSVVYEASGGRYKTLKP